MATRVWWRLRAGWAAGLMVVLVLGARATRGDDPVEPGTVSGRVVDAEGRGIAGARVRVQYRPPSRGPEAVRQELVTDGSGGFRSPPLPAAPNLGSLTVEAEGFALSRDSRRAAIFPGLDTDLGALRLDRGRTVTGRVVDADGTPRAGTEVSVRVGRAMMGHSSIVVGPQQGLTTDQDGRFRTAPLTLGVLLGWVNAPDRQRTNLPRRAIAPGPGEEDLGDIRLEPDVPISATVRDEEARPIVGATVVGPVGINERTDAAGRFTIRGLGPGPRTGLRVTQPGFTDLAGYLVGDDRGYRFGAAPLGLVSSGSPEQAVAGIAPARDLILTMRRAGAFEGLAVDAATGEPVPPVRVDLSRVERPAAGDPIVTPVNARAELLGAGRFRVPFAEAGEYRLLVTAAGHRPAEVPTPPAAERATVGGIVVRLQPAQDDAPEPVVQAVTGTVTRGGRPVAVGWATLRASEPPAMAPNAPIARGRMVPDALSPVAAAPIRDGTYALSAPEPGDAFTLVISEPGQALATVGPFPLRAGEARAVDVACPSGGRILGRVAGVPAAWRGAAWVVAFTAAGLRFEAQVEPDGSFALPPMPPGEYGLKAGHDAYDDAETYPGPLAQQHPESYQVVADPWKRAVRVRVEAGRDRDGVEVAWPE